MERPQRTILRRGKQLGAIDFLMAANAQTPKPRFFCEPHVNPIDVTTAAWGAVAQKLHTVIPDTKRNDSCDNFNEEVIFRAKHCLWLCLRDVLPQWKQFRKNRKLDPEALKWNGTSINWTNTKRKYESTTTRVTKTSEFNWVLVDLICFAPFLIFHVVL